MVSKGLLGLVTLEAGGTFLHGDKVQAMAKRRDGEVKAKRLFEDEIVLVHRDTETGEAVGVV